MMDVITEIVSTMETLTLPSSEVEDPIDMQLSNESLDLEDRAKFQKEISFNKLLPYAAELDEEADQFFAKIKANLGRCVMLRDIHPGALYWVCALNR